MEQVDLYGELRNLIAEMESAGVGYALCGGLAVAVHGFVRATVDIDLIIRKSDLAKAKAAAQKAGFIFDSGVLPIPIGPFEVHRVAKVVGEDVLMVDFLINLKDKGFWKRREFREWEGGRLAVLRKDALIEMKGSSKRGKDRIDINELEGRPDEG